jgi:hypothetical protein
MRRTFLSLNNFGVIAPGSGNAYKSTYNYNSEFGIGTCFANENICVGVSGGIGYGKALYWYKNNVVQDPQESFNEDPYTAEMDIRKVYVNPYLGFRLGKEMDITLSSKINAFSNRYYFKDHFLNRLDEGSSVTNINMYEFVATLTEVLSARARFKLTAGGANSLYGPSEYYFILRMGITFKFHSK